MKFLFAIALLFAANVDAWAQLTLPLDVTASAVIRDAAGVPVAGNNPAAETPIPGALVQIINVGANGVADLPNLDGTPAGDDTVLATTVIGQGMPLDVEQTGRFSTSLYPPPTGKVYARVFDAPTLPAATHYGQSATFTPHNSDVFDISVLGLTATQQPLGTNPTITDTDSDGETDWQELIANTNPLDAGDCLDVAGFALASEVSIAGRAGRQFILQRNTNDLAEPTGWTDVDMTGVLSADGNLTLRDPNPPATPKAFYRIRVVMP